MLTTSGSASLKKPPLSPSVLRLIRVPPSTRSKVVRASTGKGNLLFSVYFRFGSYSVISASPSIRRPRNWLTECHVVPTPIGPLDVFLFSRLPDCHFGLFSLLLRTAKTSSVGRLIRILGSIFAISLFSVR